MNIPSSFLSFFAILALSTLTTFPRTDFLSGRETRRLSILITSARRALDCPYTIPNTRSLIWKQVNGNCRLEKMES